MRAEEKNKTKTEELLCQQKKNRTGYNQEPLEPSIYEEERILKLMEEGESLLGPGKAHRFVLAMRNDTMKNTGCPKYLPIKTCENDGINCELI